MVSKMGHCLNDLLFRARTGDIPVEIVAVVSNHRDQEGLVQWHGIPFFHLPVTKDTKPEAEAAANGAGGRASTWNSWSWPVTCRS